MWQRLHNCGLINISTEAHQSQLPSDDEFSDHVSPEPHATGMRRNTPAPPSRKLSVGQILLRVIIPILILAAGAGVMIAAGKMKPAPKKEVTVVPLPRVKTVAIEPWNESMTLDVDGSVVPFREVNVMAEVAGRIIKKTDACRAGKFVKEGTPLFEIDPVSYSLRKEQLSKQLRQSEIGLHQVDVELENLQDQIALAMEDARLQGGIVARLQPLASQGVSSPTEVDQSKRAEISSRTNLQQLKNQTRVLVTRRASQKSAIDVALAQLEQAELDLKRTKVFAPSDGVIVNEPIQQDQFVPVGMNLTTIEDTSSVEVLCDLRSDYLYQLWESLDESAAESTLGSYELPRVPAVVIYQVAGRRFAWEGRLDRYDGLGVDPRTRTVPVRVVVKNPRDCRCLDDGGGRVRPPALIRGMYVTVQLQVDTAERQLARLPSSAIRPGKMIYRVEDGKLRKEKVRLARITDKDAILELDGTGYKIGDSVIISPLPSPEEGMELEVAGAAESKTMQPEPPPVSVQPNNANVAQPNVAQPDNDEGKEPAYAPSPSDQSDDILEKMSIDLFPDSDNTNTENTDNAPATDLPGTIEPIDLNVDSLGESP